MQRERDLSSNNGVSHDILAVAKALKRNGNLRYKSTITIRFDSLLSDSSSSQSETMSSTFHAFALPADLLHNITSRSRLSQQPVVEPERTEQQDPPSQTAPIQGSRACNVCLGATFVDVEEQRAHFRSDWHRYNVKIRLRGGKPTSEADFAKLMDSMYIGTGSCTPCPSHPFRSRRFPIWLRLRL